MFDKLFAFLGFNSGESYVGLYKLVDNSEKLECKARSISQQKLKLSDLMRGN